VLSKSWDGLMGPAPVAMVEKPFSQEELLEGINAVREAATKWRELTRPRHKKNNGNGLMASV
jgi:hypothetical protein